MTVLLLTYTFGKLQLFVQDISQYCWCSIFDPHFLRFLTCFSPLYPHILYTVILSVFIVYQPWLHIWKVISLNEQGIPQNRWFSILNPHFCTFLAHFSPLLNWKSCSYLIDCLILAVLLFINLDYAYGKLHHLMSKVFHKIADFPFWTPISALFWLIFQHYWTESRVHIL